MTPSVSNPSCFTFKNTDSNPIKEDIYDEELTLLSRSWLLNSSFVERYISRRLFLWTQGCRTHEFWILGEEGRGWWRTVLIFQACFSGPVFKTRQEYEDGEEDEKTNDKHKHQHFSMEGVFPVGRESKLVLTRSWFLRRHHGRGGEELHRHS